MFKLVLEPACSGTHTKLALAAFRNLNISNRSTCVRRYTKKSFSNRKEYANKQVGEVTYKQHTRSSKLSKSSRGLTDESEPKHFGLNAEKYYNDGVNNRSRPVGSSQNYDIESFQEKDFQGRDGDNMSRKSSKHFKLPSNWANEFGTFSKQRNNADMTDIPMVDESEEEISKRKRLSRNNRRHIPNWYARKIQKLGKQGEVRKAIEVFDEWMIERDRVKPTGFEYAVLIKLLSDVGYTEKAFLLYKDMLSRQIEVEGQIYTGLFNACANSPWPEDGLKHATALSNKMLRKNITPNFIIYLSMIKAFGMCGDLETAFTIADEAARVKVDEDILSNLLCACVSDKKSGFKHAILVWRKFRSLGIKPSLRSYNLLLRCVDECGIGDPALLKSFIDQSSGNVDGKSGKEDDNRFLIDGERQLIDVETIDAVNVTDIDAADKDSGINNKRKATTAGLKHFERKSFKQLDQLMDKYGFLENAESEINDTDDVVAAADDDIVTENINETFSEEKEWWQQDIFETSTTTLTVQDSRISKIDGKTTLPDILEPDVDMKYTVDVGKLRKKHDRFDLLGGMDGVLLTLARNNIKPDLSTFTLISRSVRCESLEILINKMWSMKVKPDIIFYNHCIQENATTNPDIAWALFNRLLEEGLVPNIRTYSIIARACKRHEDGKELIQKMLDSDIVPNTYTFCNLLFASSLNFYYKIYILRTMDDLGVKCDVSVVRQIENNLQYIRKTLHGQEVRHSSGQFVSEKQEEYLKSSRKMLMTFHDFYDKWLQKHNIAEKPHPWKSFKPLENDYEDKYNP